MKGEEWDDIFDGYFVSSKRCKGDNFFFLFNTQIAFRSLNESYNEYSLFLSSQKAYINKSVYKSLNII